MARDRNTFAKQQRETEKKRKAADKRVHRQKRKEQADAMKGQDRDDRPVDEGAVPGLYRTENDEPK